MKKQSPYGSWPSTITADMVAGKSSKISDTRICDGKIFWCQSVTEEKGRIAVMMHDGNGTRCLLPRPLSARSKVHEYGGAAFAVHGNWLYFVLADDQRVYRLNYREPKARPEAMTPEDAGYRFADLQIDCANQRLIAVCEHHDGQTLQTENFLAAIPLDGSCEISVLTQGHDFYSNPRISNSGKYLTWLTWDHPDMPWDNSTLWVGELEHGKISSTALIAGNGNESIFQPQWSPIDELFFVSDRTNWWNLYRVKNLSILERSHVCQPILQKQAEFATPQWVFGMSTYGFMTDKSLTATYTENGKWQLIQVSIEDETISTNSIKTNSTTIHSVACGTGMTVFIGASPTEDNTLYSYKNGEILSITKAETGVNPAEISYPQAISFPTSHDSEAKALFYSPHNSNYESLGESPPLIVICHGGPTGATESHLNLKIQYWTNRGFAVADVNNRGSTGYGRIFRQSLFEKWGIYDVDDVCAVVSHLDAQGLIDKSRAIIKGSSAGGYTALAALTFRDTFSAGVSLYGVGDLETLARDTHKFEARYLDKLVGPYPQSAEIYRERSPIYFARDINCPLLIFQGLRDRVVPPSQAEDMFNAVNARGLPVAYVTYEEEAHGFRDADTIIHVLESEHQFYTRLFHMQPNSSPQAPLKIYNLAN